MGLEQIKIVEEVGSLAELYEQVARLQRTLRHLLNGNLDFQNISVGGIKAQNIDVDKLSAIVADLGEVNAGIMRGIQIFGSFFATAESGYPRIEISGDNKYIKLFLNETTYLEILHQGVEGFPQINFVKDGKSFRIGHGVDNHPYAGLTSSDPFVMFAWGGLYLAGANILRSWGDLHSEDDGKTLKQELDGLRSSITSLNNSISTLTNVINDKANKNVSTSSAGGHNHGISDGTVLMRYDGSPVTYSSYSGHSHTQN